MQGRPARTLHESQPGRARRPLQVRLAEGLGYTGLRRLHHIEGLADDQHGFVEGPPGSVAFACEEVAMGASPKLQRSIPFALGSSKLCADLIEGHDFNRGSSDHTQWNASPVCHDAQIAGLR